MVGSWTDKVQTPIGVWFSTAQSTHLPEHSHLGTELNLLMQGSVEYQVGSTHVTANAGEILVLPAGVPHELLRATKNVAVWVVETKQPVQNPALSQLGTIFPDRGVQLQMQRLAHQLWLRPASREAEPLENSLMHHLEQLQSSSAYVAPAKEHEAVTRARILLENVETHTQDMSHIARAAGISSSRLSHLFAEQLGISPLQYRNFARVQHLIQRYTLGSGDLLAAALRAGFGSYAQFHRVFRQVCGVSPNQHMAALMQCPQIDAQKTFASQVAS